MIDLMKLKLNNFNNEILDISDKNADVQMGYDIIAKEAEGTFTSVEYNEINIRITLKGQDFNITINAYPESVGIFPVEAKQHEWFLLDNFIKESIELAKRICK